MSTISNTDLHARMAVLDSKLADHSAATERSRAETAARLDKIMGKLSEKEVRLSLVEQGIHTMSGTLVEIRDSIKDAAKAGRDERAANTVRIEALERAGVIYDAQTGVWKAIINSRPVLWFIALMGTVAAYIFGRGGT